MAGQAFAHDQILGMPFGKLIHVGPGDQLIPLALKGGDRQLNKVDARQQVVEVVQFQLMEHIFTVVQDDTGIGNRLVFIVFENGLDNPVQAVCLAGGAIVGHFNANQLFIAPTHTLHFINGSCVVAVSADEDGVILVLQCADHVFEHGGDHVIFQPRRNHDRQGLLRFGPQLLCREFFAFEALIDRKRTVDTSYPIPGIDEQVINAGQHDQDADDHCRNL